MATTKIKFAVETDAPIVTLNLVLGDEDLLPIDLDHGAGSLNLEPGFYVVRLFLRGTVGQTAKFTVSKATSFGDEVIEERGNIQITQQNGEATIDVAFEVR